MTGARPHPEPDDHGRAPKGAAGFLRAAVDGVVRAIAPRSIDATLMDRARPVRCYHCGKWHEAPRRAVVTACPHCFRQLSIQDLLVRTSQWGGVMLSCGSLHVERHGRLQARLVVVCAGATIEGSVESTVISGGPVRLGPFAVVRGAIRAPALEVQPGAVMVAARVEVPHDAIGRFDPSEAGRFGLVRGAVTLDRASALRRSAVIR